METVIGKDGVKTTRKVRKEFYVCDLDMYGMKKLKQTTLYFTKTTPKVQDNTLVVDTIGKERFSESKENFPKTSVGQLSDCALGDARTMENVVDNSDNR